MFLQKRKPYLFICPACVSTTPSPIHNPPPVPSAPPPTYKNDTRSRYTFEQKCQREINIHHPWVYIFYYKCFLMLFVLCYLGFDLSRFLLKIGRPTAGASCVLSFWSLVPSSLSAINNPDVLIQRSGAYDFLGR